MIQVIGIGKGKMHLDKKDYANAQKSFQQVVDVEPGNMIACYGLAQSFLNLKLNDEDALWFKNVLHLETGDSVSEKKLQRKARHYHRQLSADKEKTASANR